MPSLKDRSVAVLVGAVVVLSVACAPRSARWSASRGAPAPCDKGVAVLQVQNDLGESIQLIEAPRARSPLPGAAILLGPGWHTLEIDQTVTPLYYVRTVGQTPFASRGVPTGSVRMMIRCLPSA